MPISRAELCARWGARLVFVAAAVMVVDAAMAHVALPPLHPMREYSFFDLKVYRHAGVVVRDGGPLYSVKLRRGLGFTYPPFAVLLFLPLTWMSLRHAELLVTISNLLLIAVAVQAAMHLGRGPHRTERFAEPAASRRTAGSAAVSALRRLGRAGSAWGWLAAAAALWFEPIVSALGYGQIDLLIAALVIADLAYGRRTRAGGIGIGLAAALKLTPLVFIPYLALTGRARMAARALATFAVAVAISFVVLPSDALKYWGGKFVDVSRVTGHGHDSGAGVANQSLRGALLRLLPNVPHLAPLWMLAALLIGGLALLLAVRAARRGDELWGFLLTALGGLLVSPVSWTHHWALLIPGLLALVVTNRRRPLAGAVTVAAVLLFARAGYRLWPLILRRPLGHHPASVGVVAGSPYVIAGLAAIGTATALELARAIRQRRRPDAALSGIAGKPLAHGRQLGRAPGNPGPALRAITTSQTHAAD